MSYFIKNGDGQCFSDKVPNCRKLKYAGTISASTRSVSSITGTPYIAIKDASYPINYDSYVSYDVAVNKLNDDVVTAQYHRCIFVGSFLSRSDDYTITWNENEKRFVSDLQWKNKIWNFKELYAGNKPIVSYVNPEYGNMLTFKLNDSRSLTNYYRPADDYTYGPVSAGDTDDFCLLSNYEDTWLGNDNTKSFDYLDSDESNNTTTAKVFYFRKKPLKYNDKFGYDFKSDSDLSYFTLNVDDIKATGKTKIKLQYLWNVLFNDKQNDNNVLSEIQNRFDAVTLDGHSFVYNYCLSDNSTWEKETEGKKYQIGSNLSSSIYKDANVWHTSDHIVSAEFKTLCNSKPELDYLNDPETCKRFYATWVNNTSETDYENADSDVSQKIIVNGADGKKFITALGCIEQANDSEPSHTAYNFDYSKGNSARVYIDNEWVLAEAKIDITAGTEFNKNDWNIIPKSEYMATAHKYNLTTGWLSGQYDLLSEQYTWGPYSGSFIPYIYGNDNYCHWDTSHGDNWDFTKAPDTNFNCSFLWSENVFFTNYRSVVDYNYIADKGTIIKDNIVYVMQNGSPSLLFGIDLNVEVIDDFHGYPENVHKGQLMQRKLDEKFFIVTADANMRDYVYDYNGQPSPQYNDGKIPWTDTYEGQYPCLVGPYTEDEVFDSNFNYTFDILVEPFYFWERIYPLEEFSKNKNYEPYTIVTYEGEYYKSNTSVMSGSDISSTLFNEYYYSMAKSRNNYNKFMVNTNSYNYIGHSEFTIDLSTATEKYLHISNPVTYLFNTPLGGVSNFNPFITDFKFTYEAVD